MPISREPKEVSQIRCCQNGFTAKIRDFWKHFGFLERPKAGPNIMIYMHACGPKLFGHCLEYLPFPRNLLSSMMDDWVHAATRICVFVYLYLCICIRICVFAYLCICVFAYLCICISSMMDDPVHVATQCCF